MAGSDEQPTSSASEDFDERIREKAAASSAPCRALAQMLAFASAANRVARERGGREPITPDEMSQLEAAIQREIDRLRVARAAEILACRSKLVTYREAVELTAKARGSALKTAAERVRFMVCQGDAQAIISATWCKGPMLKAEEEVAAEWRVPASFFETDPDRPILFPGLWADVRDALFMPEQLVRADDRALPRRGDAPTGPVRAGRSPDWPWEALAFALGQWKQANPNAKVAAQAAFLSEEAERLTGRRPTAKHCEAKIRDWRRILEEN